MRYRPFGLAGQAVSCLTLSLGARDIAGGAVYDALVAAVAVEHQLRLLSRDRRALGVYRDVGATVELLD